MMVSDADVALRAIYATEALRTQQTAAPAAEARGLPIITDIDPEEALAAEILCAHGGDTVLHVGHSYTLPAFFYALGLADPPSVSGYGQLFRVAVGTDATATVTEARFGDSE